MTDASATPVDPMAMMRSRRFLALLVLAGIVGMVVSVLSWAFLEAVYWTQQGAYHDLPDALGSTACRPGGRCPC